MCFELYTRFTILRKHIHYRPSTMFRRVKVSTLCFSFGLSVLLILIVHYTNNTNQPLNNKFIIENKQFQVGIPTNYDGSPDIKKLLEQIRKQIKLELLNYNFTQSGVSNLNDLLFETGGMPIRSVVISTWRSGSTFLGQILNAMTANYYHYEPFFEHKFSIRGPPFGDKALKMVTNLLKCKYVDMEDYFQYRRSNPDQFTHNTRLWNICKHKIELCLDPDIMSQICKLYPFQSMKLVRYRLRLAKELLDDKE